MIVIKVFSQDLYVTEKVSTTVTPLIEKELALKPNQVVFIGGDQALVVNGVEQIGWFTYLEIEMPVNLMEHKELLTDILHEAFLEFGVHLAIRFKPYELDDLVTLIDKDYKVFGDTYVTVGGIEDDEGDAEPYLGDVFEHSLHDHDEEDDE